MLAPNFDKIRPTLNSDVEIHKVSENEFILFHTKLNHQLRVNKLTVDLLEMTNGQMSISELSANLSKISGQSIDQVIVYDLLYGTLFKSGLIDANPEATARSSSNYLSLRFTLIPKEIVSTIGTKFSFLFVGRTFIKYSILTLLIVLTTNTIIFFKEIFQARHDLIIDEGAFLYLFLFGFLICLIHEIGHASALKFYNRNAGDIGVGFYMFYPVFFCDVSEAWYLKKYDRIIVNLGGIYFELIVSVIFITIFQLTHANTFAWLASIILLRILLNLNPFLRRDGYWILSDVVNIPSLQSDSIQHVKSTLQHLFRRQAKNLDFRPFIFLYGVFSASFILLFILFIVVLNPTSVITFPIAFWDFITNSNDHEFTLHYSLFVLQTFGLGLLFYYLVIKFIIKSLKG